MDSVVPWNKVVIPPGDTLTAHVPNNSDLRIKYRRAGLFGIFERRAVLGPETLTSERELNMSELSFDVTAPWAYVRHSAACRGRSQLLDLPR